MRTACSCPHCKRAAAAPVPGEAGERAEGRALIDCRLRCDRTAPGRPAPARSPSAAGFRRRRARRHQRAVDRLPESFAVEWPREHGKRRQRRAVRHPLGIRGDDDDAGVAVLGDRARGLETGERTVSQLNVGKQQARPTGLRIHRCAGCSRLASIQRRQFPEISRSCRRTAPDVRSRW